MSTTIRLTALRHYYYYYYYLLLLLLLLLFIYLFHGSAIAGVHGDINNHGVLFKVKTFVESFVLETRIR